MIRIYRYEVPVDGQLHRLELRGCVVAVDCRKLEVVEFWAEHDTAADVEMRTFTVIGTGRSYPEPWHVRYRGHAVVPGGAFVWHLLELEERW